MEPDAIRNQRFLLVRRGYDPEAVQDFLEDVAGAVEELRARLDDPEDGPGTELAEARRLVDEARTRAATHRLRAQRDVEALERTARQRRARLLGEIEELAAARDQLSTDLDRAIDVVDRVVQWVRRTDPATASRSEAVDAASPAVPPADDGPVGPAPPHDGDAATPRVDTEVTAPEPAGVENEVAAPEPGAEVPEAAPDEAAPEPDLGQPASDEVAEAVDVAPETDDADGAEGEEIAERPEDLVEDLAGGDDPMTVPETTVVVAVREALRAVQDEVLANLRDHPRGDVPDWLPGGAALDTLDDAATDAAREAFLDGWNAAAPNEDAAAGPDRAHGRDALERLRGSGELPGLDVGDDLRTTLEASLARGRTAGEAEVTLRERVAEVHRDLRQTQLPEAVEQVVSAARHHGLLARWRADGVAAVAWVVGQEQRCPGRRCRGNATDGVVAPGESFAFGDVVPPAHPGCTCTLRPIREA